MKIKEKNILNISAVVGIALLPILFRKPGIKKWSVIHIANAITSHLLDHYLVETKKLKYPTRIFPKTFKIHVVYDYLFCPLLSVIYCQTSYNSGFFSSIVQGFLFGIPQVMIEYFAEKKTKIIKYAKGWTWIDSYLGIVAVKLTFRGLTELIKPKEHTAKKDEKNSHLIDAKIH